MTKLSLPSSSFLLVALAIFPVLILANPNSALKPNFKYQESVRGVFRGSLPEIEKCYQDELKVKPDLAGKLVVKLTLNEKGLVTSTSIKSSSLKDSQVENCILKRIRELKFPPPPQGKLMEIDYPFVFGTQN